MNTNAEVASAANLKHNEQGIGLEPHQSICKWAIQGHLARTEACCTGPEPGLGDWAGPPCVHALNAGRRIQLRTGSVKKDFLLKLSSSWAWAQASAAEINMATAQYGQSGTMGEGHPDPDPDPEVRNKSPNSVPDCANKLFQTLRIKCAIQKFGSVRQHRAVNTGHGV